MYPLNNPLSEPRAQLCLARRTVNPSFALTAPKSLSTSCQISCERVEEPVGTLVEALKLADVAHSSRFGFEFCIGNPSLRWIVPESFSTLDFASRLFGLLLCEMLQIGRRLTARDKSTRLQSRRQRDPFAKETSEQSPGKINTAARSHTRWLSTDRWRNMPDAQT